MKKLLFTIIAVIIGSVNISIAQSTTSENLSKEEKKKGWFESIDINGYMQVRYNRLLETNEDYKNEQGDKSIGKNGGFFIRRGRIKISGQIADNIYFYIQPDFSVATGSSQNMLQLRDAYVDFSFDKQKEYRLRIGQSKIPFGFENMQSSQNRIPLDRNDALNSAFSNERDLGAFFYWAPKTKRVLFDQLIKKNLKGSGDFGCFAFGAFNGQTTNKADENNDLHLVTRFTYPMKIGKKQIIEPGIQAYSGNYTLNSEQISSGVKYTNNKTYLDQRIAATFVLYPQPFGIQAEYNWGKGPQYNKATDSIETRNLNGGYIMLNCKIDVKNGMVFFPFSRAFYYTGGKKHETDARSYEVTEVETGVEWQINKNFELTVSYATGNRRFEDFKKQDNYQKGGFLRLQAQLNF